MKKTIIILLLIFAAATSMANKNTLLVEKNAYKTVLDVVFGYMEKPQKDAMIDCIIKDPTTPQEEILKCLRGMNLDSAKNAHFLAKTFAVESNQITIDNCTPTPIVTQVRIDSQVNLINQNDYPIIISITGDQKFKIDAHSTQMITANFGYGPGGYAFFCEEKSSAGEEVGMFYVVE